VDETHDPARTSWVESAQGSTDFPIQNLPFGVYRRKGERTSGRVGIAIGDQILDVVACHQHGWLVGLAATAAEACAEPPLNRLMALSRAHWVELRKQISALLSSNSSTSSPVPQQRDVLLVPMAEAELLLPADIGDYTDFYASVHHASNVGRMLRPENPLFPNYKWVPIGYHGRASSIVPSGTEVRRPWGQLKDPKSETPTVGPTAAMDYEMEVGCFVGPGNPLGTAVPIAQAEEHLFGLCLLNDWSARDLQAWEYQPLGPFLAKSFATSISPWIVTFEALEPFRVPALTRPEGDPVPLPYLSSSADPDRGGVDLIVEVYLASVEMREQGIAPMRLSRGRFADLYWTVAQMFTHHTSNGCNLRPGDLFASGTVSGATKDARGCLLEITWRGAEPITLPTGESRKFLADGDEVIMRGYCERPGATRIGFGECRGVVKASEQVKQ
jgi:fumarylacetoacetase